MKTIKRLLLSALFAAAVFSDDSLQAEQASVVSSADQEMQESLAKLDSLLTLQGSPDAVPDALSELQELNKKFESLRSELKSRDQALVVSEEALKEAEAQNAKLVEQAKKSGKPEAKVLIAEREAEVKNLVDENQILKDEIEKQHQRVEKAETDKRQVQADFDRLFNDGGAAREKEASREAKASKDALAETEKLKTALTVAEKATETLRLELDKLRDEKTVVEGTLSQKTGVTNDDQRERDLMASVEEMKAVDAQRKSAMDDLFRQLAAHKKEMDTLNAEIIAGREALAQADEKIAGREQALAARDEELALLNKTVTETRSEQESLNTKLATMDRAVKENADTAARRATELQALQQEMDRVKLVDEQRRKTLDETLASLAEARQQVSALTGELKQARADDAARAQVLATRDEQLAAQEKSRAEELVKREELNVKQAEMARVAKESADTVAVRERELQALQQEMDRVKLVDEQRRKTLDETLAELADAKQLAGGLSAELEQVRVTRAEEARQCTEKLETLTARNTLLEGEIGRMESDDAAANEERNAALAKTQELRTALSERDRQVVDLEEQVSRLTVVDEQRRKAMDRVLLDVALLEQEKGKLKTEMQRLETVDVASTAVTPVAPTDAELAGVRSENITLQNRISALEAALQARGVETAAAVTTEPAADLREVELAQLEQVGWAHEKQQMVAQLQELREASTRDAERLQQMTKELEQARQTGVDLMAKVTTLEDRKTDIRTSDLFKEQEQINASLREKLLEVESERQRLSLIAEAADKRDTEQAQTIEVESKGRLTAETAVTEALAREGEYKEFIERLVPQVTELEKQVTDLTQERETLTNQLRGREEDLQTLKVELERREYRLAKAERVAEVLEKARTDVQQAGNREKQNMHYNMALVYARESKFSDAENEYLQALRIDPTDADVHYNLGILYDDELKQPEKAVMHYRRYLQLNPGGPDADRVRNWLMKLEMNNQR